MKAVRDVLWAKQTRETLAEAAKRGAIVIVPIASTEQHGRHLPVDTDVQTVEYVTRRAAQSVEGVEVLVAPTIPLGVSLHHMMHAGTISLRVKTTLLVLRDVCRSLTDQGFERILIVSGHGGNRDTIGAAALELRHRLDRQVQAICWFDLIPQALDAAREGYGVGIGHSGEIETSAILALSPEDVRTDRAELASGITDDPSLGTEAKGRQVLEAAVAALAEYLRGMVGAPSRHIPGIEPLTAPNAR